MYYTDFDSRIRNLQGRVKVPTGGTAREPVTGMIRWNSGADSIVWMEEVQQMYLIYR